LLQPRPGDGGRQLCSEGRSEPLDRFCWAGLGGESMMARLGPVFQWGMSGERMVMNFRLARVPPLRLAVWVATLSAYRQDGYRCIDLSNPTKKLEWARRARSELPELEVQHARLRGCIDSRVQPPASGLCARVAVSVNRFPFEEKVALLRFFFYGSPVGFGNWAWRRWYPRGKRLNFLLVDQEIFYRRLRFLFERKQVNLLR